jgi:hypothetical protein
VGVCEFIHCFAFPNVGTWNVLGNGRFDGVENYQAPIVSDGSSIFYAVEEVEYKFKLSIVEPSAIVSESLIARDFALNENEAGGAGMNLELYVLPREVSFSGVAMEEVPSLEGVRSGYFANIVFSDVWYHTEQMWAGRWLNIKPDNYWGTDRAWMGARLPLEKPNGEITYNLTEGSWDRGIMVWNIRWGWGELNSKRGDVPVKVMSIRYDQEFEMDQFGTLTVTKFGNVVTRGTNNVIRLNDNIVVGIPLTQEEKEEINGL